MESCSSRSKFDAIPVGTDIVVAHGPPHGFGDRTRQTHVGSTAMTATLERLQPRLMVCGHIHPATVATPRRD
jgi:Icc-related predicted phosphoesterase